MSSLLNKLRTSPEVPDGGPDVPAPPLPVIFWPHIRDSLLLLALEISIEVAFFYAEQLLPVSRGMFDEPRRALRWFMVATVCWLAADPLLRLLNNTRRGIADSGERMVSMDIDQGEKDGGQENPAQ